MSVEIPVYYWIGAAAATLLAPICLEFPLLLTFKASCDYCNWGVSDHEIVHAMHPACRAELQLDELRVLIVIDQH